MQTQTQLLLLQKTMVVVERLQENFTLIQIFGEVSNQYWKIG